MYVKNWAACRTFVAALACFVVPLSTAHAEDTPIISDSSLTSEKIEGLVRRIWEEKWCPPNSLCLDPDETETLELSGNRTYEWIVVHYGDGRLKIDAVGDLVLVAHRVLLGGRLRRGGTLRISGIAGDGSDSAAGRHGGDGDDGPDLDIRLGIVDASVVPTLGLPSFRDQLARVKISSDGGYGGNGGNGKNGGDGGDSGEIHVTVWRSAYVGKATHVGAEERDLLKRNISTEGGAGGRGGASGQGGVSGKNGENGDPNVAVVEFRKPDVRELQCEWEWLGQNQDPPQSSKLRDKLEEECAQP